MAEQDQAKRKGYQWPCSCLTAEEMAILFRLREQTGRPISRLLREAVRRLDGKSQKDKTGKAEIE